ncbi:MAG: glycoside hydrolase family 3 C-terminal domain-containing protein [Caldilineaceae bacterium]|nr:glycoside hydrolase family 3 C-terminal domain-containing protein [Caldilineaceae bacterium]
MDEKIDAILAQLTLEQKVSLCAGSDTWRTVAIPGLVPQLKVSDGPNGARGDAMPGDRSSATAACFPVGICLAASWDTTLIQEIGVALAEELKTKHAQVLLGPTVNIHRSPLNGRNFECYSEDPYLTARMAVAYINGVQSQGVGACIKHFVANDSEFQRQSISSEVRDRGLYEIYLPPFEAAVKEADVWTVMSGYNRLNGVYCSENDRLLKTILRDEWGFDGLVMSDWFGTYDTMGIADSGLDLEMPGPARFMGEQLLAAVQRGDVAEAAIDAKVRNVLRLVFRAGVTETPEPPEESIDRPEHRALIRRAAAAGAVLLKNDDATLPLNAADLGTLAVIGPNAAVASMMGGGSAQVNAHYSVAPLEGLRNRLGDTVRIDYAQGCAIYRTLPPVDAALLTTPDGAPGLRADFFNGSEPTGDVVASKEISDVSLLWLGAPAPGVNPVNFALRLSGRLTPAQSGPYTIALTSAGLSRLYLDGAPVIDNWTSQRMGGSFFGMGSYEETAVVDLVAGQAHEIVVEYTRNSSMLGALVVGGLPVATEDPILEAEKIAAGADAVLLFVGTNGEWESEGFDRPDMAFPGRQAELIERVAAVNPKTIVVLNTGSPMDMAWLDQVPAVLEAWFPGQECGNAIADVLFGDVNPSGRLTQTWPLRLEDNPAFINYPGDNGRVYYGEDIFVGYRYYEKKNVGVRFPFGYGLSYTTFAVDNLRLSADEYALGQPVDLLVDVTNTGTVAGHAVVQIYVHDVDAGVMRPEKELKAFAKVALEPGERKSVHLSLDQRALSFFDDARHAWVAEAGEFDVLAGLSSADIGATARFTLTVPAEVAAAMPAPVALSIRSTLRDVISQPAGRAVLDALLPGMADSPQAEMAMGMTLEAIAGFVPNILTKEKLAAIDEELRAIG